MIHLSDAVVVRKNVLVRLLEKESVLVNVQSERYFGLDAVGTRMWQVATAAPDVRAALEQLCQEYDAEPSRVSADFLALLRHLLENDLIATRPADNFSAAF